MPTNEERREHMTAAEFNWRQTFGGTPMCPDYIGCCDWGIDCKLKYGLCGGPDSPDCPKNKEDKE